VTARSGADQTGPVWSNPDRSKGGSRWRRVGFAVEALGVRNPCGRT
jgi:hypothetical protein